MYHDLYFLIPAVIAQIFIPIAELVTPIAIQTKEGKAEMQTRPVIVEIKISKGSWESEIFKEFLKFIKVFELKKKNFKKFVFRG